MTEFSNSNISPFKLPDIDNVEYNPLERKFLSLQVFYILVTSVILLIGAGILYLWGPDKIPSLAYLALTIAILLRTIFSLIVSYFGFRHKAFALREKDIIYKSGWIFRSVTIVPFNRVQHLQIDQGPVERKFDLARLKIFTAGGQSSDLSIPGIRLDRAQKLKQFIVSKSALDEEE